MAQVRPFRALRPVPAAAARVASVPYDVVSTEEARALAAGNPDSYLHVTRAEIDLPPGCDEHADEVYLRGRDNLAALRARGVLVDEAAPALYLYRLVMEGRAQTGLVAGYSVAEYDRGAIRKHEHTRPDKVADRARHVDVLGVHAEPVFLVHRPTAALRALTAAAGAGPPLFDFTAPDGVQHTLWRIDEPGPWVEAMGALPALYVADGHHRSAAASEVARRRGAGPGDPAGSFLAVSFPADEVRVLPYNRLVRDLNGRTPAELLEALRAAGLPPVPDVGPVPPRGQARLLVDGRWWGLPLVAERDDPVGRLDVQVLQDRVLAPLLGIADPRTERRIAFVGGIRGTGELEREVASGRFAAAFSLAPVTTDELLAVADAGLVMPPKSTWFEPKLRSGLFVYPLAWIHSRPERSEGVNGPG